METGLVILSALFLFAGAFFIVTGAIGIYRFPDFYSRLHGAGMTDTLGVELILVGLILHAGLTLISVKLVFIGLFLFFTSPTSTHAIANAALTAGLQPFLSVLPQGWGEREGQADDPDTNGEAS